jgi:hypothetical protein
MVMDSAVATILSANNPAMVIVWSLSLLALLAAGYLVVSHLRRRYVQPKEDVPNTGFTLADLRELHRQGKMSDEEFAAAKAKVVEAAQRAAAEQARRERGADKSAVDVGFQQKIPPDSTQADKNQP